MEDAFGSDLESEAEEEDEEEEISNTKSKQEKSTLLILDKYEWYY